MGPFLKYSIFLLNKISLRKDKLTRSPSPQALSEPSPPKERGQTCANSSLPLVEMETTNTRPPFQLGGKPLGKLTVQRHRLTETEALKPSQGHRMSPPPAAGSHHYTAQGL